MVLYKRDVAYKIDTPGFEGMEFTESSKYNLKWWDAVQFARGKMLQSVREAGAFSIEAGDEDHAKEFQATRTTSVYFNDGNKLYVAFDDIPDRKENIVCSYTYSGHMANKEGRELMLLKKDKHIARLLKRAEKTDRIVELVESPLELATKANNGVSEFGSNKTVQALFGDIAEPYARMLYESGSSKAFVLHFLPAKWGKPVADDIVFVRPVGLGVNYMTDVACYPFTENGYARGVRGARKFSK